MDFPRFRLPLWVQIFLIAGLASLLSVGGVGFRAFTVVKTQLEEHLKEHVMNLSWAMSYMPSIQEGLHNPETHPHFWQVLDRIQEKTGVAFIVPIRRTSLSSPKAKYVQEGRVLGKGEAYFSRGAGPMGPSLRGLVPVIHQGEQVGALSVGVLAEDVQATLDSLFRKLWSILGLGLVFAVFGALLVAWNVKRNLWGLEPEQIGRLYEERESILESIREGILAVDRKGRISLLNSSARKLINLGGNLLGEPVERVVPQTQLPRVIESGIPQYDAPMTLRKTKVMANRIPISLRGKVVGAVASFRDMTEVQTLAEEVTGVTTYLEALRVQHHEFRNKLQTISGLVQLGETERVLDFIDEAVAAQEALASPVTRYIKNPEVAGMVLGKMGRAKELGVTFILDPQSVCPREPHIPFQNLVVIIGNLLDNAMEAVRLCASEQREVRFGIYHSNGEIRLVVEDGGKGIPQGMEDHIFKRGFSTKEDTLARGYGLHTVHSLVETLGGAIHFERSSKDTTIFTVTLPRKEVE